MRATTLVAGAAVVLAVAGTACVPLAEKFLAGKIKAEFERSGQVSVATVEVGLLDRSLVLEDVRSHFAGSLTARKWQASGLAWSLSDVMAGHLPTFGLQPGDPFHARRIEITDLEFVEPSRGGRWSVASLAMDEVDLARYDPAVPDPYAGSVRTARIVEALSIGHLEANRAIYAVPVLANTLGFASAAIDRLSHGKIGRLGILSLEATAKDGVEPALKVAGTEVSDLDFSQVLATLAEGNWHPGAPLGRLEADEASATGFSGALFARYGLSLDRIVSKTVHDSATVSHSRTQVEGFVMAPPLTGLETLQLRVLLAAMGLKELKLGLDCAGGSDRTKGEISVDRCVLAGPDLGELSLSAKFVDADEIFWRAIDRGDYLAVGRSKLALASAELALADGGLLDRALRALAATSGQPAAIARSNLAVEIRHYQPSGILISDALGKLLDTTARFIEQGGKLVLTAKPDPPVVLNRLDRLSRPGFDLVELLGLSATQSPR